MKISIVRNVLEANERIARENKRLFDEKGVLVINLMSGPGAGKTSLLERTIEALKDKIKMGVVEGDIQTSKDAERIASLNIPVVQINTDGACHLDGNMVKETLEHFPLHDLDLLVVENVGNLVCPAEFNIGEDFKVMLLSVTEGEDKPEKYPLMFMESKVLLINKIDLLPYLDVSIESIKAAAKRVNPELTIFEVSCKTGAGLESWYDWLLERISEKTKRFKKA